MSLTTHALTIGYAAPRKPPVIVSRDLNLELAAGELVCLIGPNGAGKSTLIRTLTAMHPPLSGSVQLNGEDLHRLKPRELALRISVVLTDRPHTANLTGYALVALGRHPHTDWSGALTPADEAIVHEAVLAVGAADYAARLVAELSDGQRQKLMIARALAQQTPVMVLDEPTAFLDLPRRVETIRLLKTLTRETSRAILLSTHDLDLALRTADRIWLIAADGTLATGAPEDLVMNGAFQAAFAADGISFDALTGSFHVSAATRGTVRLNAGGDALARVWTRRALERAGWHVSDTDAPDSAPTVTLSAGGWGWQAGTQRGHCESLYVLISTLTQITPSA